MGHSLVENSHVTSVSRTEPGRSALELGMFGALLVAGAVVAAAASPLTVAGLALASAGVVLSGGGLALAVAVAHHGRPRANRAAMSAAALSVVGLAGGLTWLSALVITVVTGSGPMAPAEVASSPACLSAAPGDYRPAPSACLPVAASDQISSGGDACPTPA